MEEVHNKAEQNVCHN